MLGTEKKKEAGYIRGVMDQLKGKGDKCHQQLDTLGGPQDKPPQVCTRCQDVMSF